VHVYSLCSYNDLYVSMPLISISKEY